MQKDECNYTFLLTRKSRSRIYIRRIEISKKLVHNTTVAALFLGIMSLAIFSISNFDSLYLTRVNAQNQTALVNQTVSFTDNKAKTYDYSRPTAGNKIGGPVGVDYQLTNESESEEAETETQLRAIETTSDPQSLPSMWAHLGKINNEYGYRRNPFGGRSYEFHPGLDIDGERGDSVIAPANGVVVKAGWQGGYGNMIEIDHGNGLSTRYGHLSQINVQVGDRIERGQPIGLIGSTGRSTGPHLHFEIRLGDKSINPRRFLPPEITQ